MWAVIKFKKDNLALLQKDLTKKLGSEPKIYIPKIYYQYVKGNKNFEKVFFILGDYLFCSHSAFRYKKTVTLLKNCKGLKYFIPGFEIYQKEIQEFILQCTKNEDKNGYLKQTFFEISVKKDFKFLSGPFTDMIFKIINIQKSTLKILVGNIVTTMSNKKNYLYRPV